MLRPCTRRTGCAVSLLSGEELGAVDFGARQTGNGVPKPGAAPRPPSRFSALRISLKASPSPPGLSLA